MTTITTNNNPQSPALATEDIKDDALFKVASTCNDSDQDVYHHTDHVVYTEEEGRRVLRKIDLVLLPLMCGCYIFSFIDKTLLNYSSTFGLQKALHLHGQDYSWCGSIFYFGYMLGTLIWSKIVQRFPGHIGKTISSAVMIWSIIILLTPLCTDFAGIMTNRFFLGFVESITGAIFVVVTSNWWTRREQAFRTAFWLGGTPIGNFIGGLLSYAIGNIHSSIPTWKLFFLFFGAFSFGFALIMAYLMPDHQRNARWLNPREQEIAIERVRENQTVTSSHTWKWNQFREALLDPQTILFFITAMGNTLPSTFASQFSSQIVKGFGFTAIQTTLVSTCPAATIQLLTFLVGSYLASRIRNSRLIIGMICSIPPLIGATLLHVLPVTNTRGRLAGYYLTYTHTMSFTLATSLMASNYAGHTKKTTANAFIYVGWAAGLIAGPQFFLSSQAPNYQMAFEMLMVCYALMIVVPLIQLAYYTRENRRRQRLTGGNVDAGEIEFTDKTDREQWSSFRYAM